MVIVADEVKVAGRLFGMLEPREMPQPCRKLEARTGGGATEAPPRCSHLVGDRNSILLPLGRALVATYKRTSFDSSPTYRTSVPGDVRTHSQVPHVATQSLSKRSSLRQSNFALPFCLSRATIVTCKTEALLERSAFCCPDRAVLRTRHILRAPKGPRWRAE